jgi:hypothetical protein
MCKCFSHILSRSSSTSIPPLLIQFYDGVAFAGNPVAAAAADGGGGGLAAVCDGGESGNQKVEARQT